MLNLSQIKDLTLKANSFRKMPNLRFVNFYSSNNGSCKVDLPRSIELPSRKLSYLRWDKYPLPSLPANFSPEKLIMICLRGSNITKLWDGVQNIVNLKEIDLWGCSELMELPDFSKASKLERVSLAWCSSLRHIHPSLLCQDTLVYLAVYECEKLVSLESDRHFKSLEHIDLYGCSSLEKFALSSEKFEVLNFYALEALETLTSSLGRCRNLEELSLAGCDKLFQLPHNITMLSSLKELNLLGSNVESLPEGICHLSSLELLDVSHCLRLRSLPELPPSIKRLWARDCLILETVIPPTALEHCDLKGCVKLDEQSLSCIKEYVDCRIKQLEITEICLPVDRVLGWFSYLPMQNRISIELPQGSNILGFVFGLYFCPDYFEYHPSILLLGCRCYLSYNDTEEFLIGECDALYRCVVEEFNSDDVYMWIYKCDSRWDSFNAISETRGNCLVSFQFYAVGLGFLDDRIEMDDFIEGCGVWPIYASELELELGDDSKRDGSELESFDYQGFEVGGLLHTNQDEQIPQKFTFQPLSIESEMLDDDNEAFDFFKDTIELEWDDKHNIFQCGPQADVQLQLSLIKKSKESTQQPVAAGLELELNTKSYSYLEIGGIQVGGIDHEKRNEHEPFHIDKRTQGI